MPISKETKDRQLASVPRTVEQRLISELMGSEAIPAEEKAKVLRDLLYTAIKDRDHYKHCYKVMADNVSTLIMRLSRGG